MMSGTRFDVAYREAVAEQKAVTFESYSPLSGLRVEVHAYPAGMLENGSEQKAIETIERNARAEAAD